MARRSPRPGPTALLLFLLVLGACSPSAPPGGVGSPPPEPSYGSSFPVTITDDDGVTVTIDARPERIVTFAPSMTEIVFALGLGPRVVGVSGPFDDHPPQARRIEEVGGAGDFGVDPNVEKVVSLEPDLFLTISGGDQWKERLRELGVPVVTLDATDLEDLIQDIRIVGLVTGAVREADAVAAAMAERAAEIEAAAGADRVSCFFEVYFPPLTSVGPGTFIYDLLERAGCDPVTASATSPYPEWSVDDLVANPPDVYIATRESVESPASVAERPGFDAIPAVAEQGVVLIDPDLVTRPGPRVIDGLAALAAALHPSGE
jgi:iron complex transport system substrate-binding protein